MSQISYCWYFIHFSVYLGLYFESNICKIFELHFLRWHQKTRKNNPQQLSGSVLLSLFPALSFRNTFHATHQYFICTAGTHQLKLNLLCNYFCFLTNLSCKKRPESSSDELNSSLSLYQLKYFWRLKVISVSLNVWRKSFNCKQLRPHLNASTCESVHALTPTRPWSDCPHLPINDSPACCRVTWALGTPNN